VKPPLGGHWTLAPGGYQGLPETVSPITERDGRRGYGCA
jgi:hypothetical protein